MIEWLYGEREAPETKLCAYCGSGIPQSASLCPVCKSSTSKAKNWITYLGTVAGFLALLGSATVFVIGRYSEVRKVLAPHRGITIIEINNGRASMNTSIQNNGDKAIYVSGIWIGDFATYRNLYDFDKVVPSGQITLKILRPNLEFPHNLFLTTPDGKIPQRALDKFTADESTSCFGFHFFSENSPALRDLRSHITKHKERIATKLVPIDISYYEVSDPVERQFHGKVEEAFYHLPSSLDCTTRIQSSEPTQPTVKND